MFKLNTYTLLTVLTVNLLATAGDICLTWSSPILPKLYSDDVQINPLRKPITPDEESWIGSLISIGALIGPFPFGVLSTRLGRKYALLAIAIPYIISFFILAFVRDLSWFYFARFLSGVAEGAGCSLLPLYLAEIAEDSNRGMISVTLNIFWTFGSLVPYTLGPYLAIAPFNLILAAVPTLFFLLFLSMGPESPYYLVKINQIERAEAVLKQLRSNNEDILEEIVKIQTTQKEDTSASLLDLFTTKANLKASGILLLLFAFQQFSGISPILFYTQTIFEKTNSNVPPEISAIIIGVVLFLSSLIIPYFADTFGRKFFFTISSLGMVLTLSVLGAYFHFRDVLSDFHWLPITTLVFYIIFFNIGYGPLPWTVGAELFSVNIKPIGASYVAVVCSLFTFLVAKFFNDFIHLLGIAGTFWLFAFFCLLATGFVLVFVPETKGKSFSEIQRILG